MDGRANVRWSERVTLAPLAASVPTARRFVRDRLNEHDLAYLIDDVVLVASELATNAAQHARTDFAVGLERLVDLVRLTVSDQSSSQPIQSEMSTAATRGRGLAIVSGYSHDWGVVVDQETKSVWASFTLRGRENVDAAAGEVRSLSAAGEVAPPSLGRLLHDVKRNRADLRAARSRGHVEAVRQAQDRLVTSLTLYVEGLAAQRLPVPYLLRDELRIYGGTGTGPGPGR